MKLSKEEIFRRMDTEEGKIWVATNLAQARWNNMSGPEAMISYVEMTVVGVYPLAETDKQEMVELYDFEGLLIKDGINSPWIDHLTPIINDYADGGEALSRYEVSDMCKLIEAAINLHQENITKEEYSDILRTVALEKKAKASLLKYIQGGA